MLLCDKLLFIESMHQCGFCTSFLSRDFVNQFSMIMTNRGFRECFSWWVEKGECSDTRSADFFVGVSSKRRKSVSQTANLSWHKINCSTIFKFIFLWFRDKKINFWEFSDGMKIKLTIFYEPKFNSALSKYLIGIQLRNGKLKGFRPLQSNKDKSLTLSHPALSSETKPAVMWSWK